MPTFPARLPTETSKAHGALCAYVALGPGRSLAKLAEAWGKSRAYVGQLERWSSSYHWQARAAAYDVAAADELARALADQRRAEIERLRAQARADAEALRALAQAAAQKLETRLHDLDVCAIEPQHLAGLLRAIAAALASALDLDAAALGVDAVLETLDELAPDAPEPDKT